MNMQLMLKQNIANFSLNFRYFLFNIVPSVCSDVGDGDGDGACSG